VVIDDFAISSIGPRERNDLLELLDDRVGLWKRSFSTESVGVRQSVKQTESARCRH
jgi:hypothetical protein